MGNVGADGSASYSKSSGTTRRHAPSYGGKIGDIKDARRLLWGNILNLQGDSPYGAPSMYPSGPAQPFQPVNASYNPAFNGGDRNSRRSGGFPRPNKPTEDFTSVQPGQGLGYSPATLTQMAQGNGAELEGGLMRLNEIFSQPGAPGDNSAEFRSAAGGMLNANVAEGGNRLRNAYREDEMLRRRDYESRLGALGQLLGQSISARNESAALNSSESSTNRKAGASAGISYI